MLKIFFSILFCLSLNAVVSQSISENSLVFTKLASRWDEAMPLGNGWLGELVWQNKNNVRISLDRIDLWDDRPMPEIDQLKFKWVVQQVQKNKYDTVQKLGDDPYDKYPAPSKIPAAALEFNCSSFGKVIFNELDIQKAICKVKFENGASLTTFVHATQEIGYFEFDNLPNSREGINEDALIPELIAPPYNTTFAGLDDNSHSGEGLQTLHYKEGNILKTSHSVRYHQPTWGGNYYEVLVNWKRISATSIIGEWTISINKKAILPSINRINSSKSVLASHLLWWRNFWNRSSVNIPDSQLQKQYYLEMYKLGCVARNNTPPISLQAIWTADNGNLPPWKGDIHNDLNTELSYWPLYTANHLEEAASFTNWLWKVKDQNKKWTKNYFGIDGLNVPGVTTISGKEMGGWIQYSMSLTTAAWLSHHFYQQWKYSMDKKFLLEKCKPYFDEVNEYFQKILILDPETKKYKLPLSSSPEINDNDITAWFHQWTNYDLSLVKSFYNEYAEIIKTVSGKQTLQVERMQNLLPALNTDSSGLTISPGFPLEYSHRHMSPYMGIYPLDLLSVDNAGDNIIIDKSLQHIQQEGTRAWCGYSFSWMANIYARTKHADSAEKMLTIFASNFCSSNSFHLNGDQKGGQYSGFTYRPFTLEGNFAFAQGIQEMLLQSHGDVIQIFPAVPKSWKNISFTNLRAEGAFLISAKQENGVPTEVKIEAEKGGLLQLKQPFKTFYFDAKNKKYLMKNDILLIEMKRGEEIILKNGFE
ncbi:MAG: glycoside hydrolase family 95-like protein [Ferruginibacter sp.]